MDYSGTKFALVDIFNFLDFVVSPCLSKEIGVEGDELLERGKFFLDGYFLGAEHHDGE